MNPLFVVLQDTADPKQTIYPQVHYIYGDDTFSPATDVLEQQRGDISLLVDIDADGQVTDLASLSPNWQILSHSLETQKLPTNFESKLLCINGTGSRQSADIPDLEGSFSGCVESVCKVVAGLERRNEEIRIALERERVGESDKADD